ncbi:MAG: beta-galactosidase [Rikenellaceae bacterium]
MKRTIISIAAAVLLSTAVAYSAPKGAERVAQQKMGELTQLIKTAESKGINTLKERTALRTAEIFLEYAAWDDKNVEANTAHFAKVGRYKKEAAKYAKLLPDFERDEIVKMMESSIEELGRVVSGETTRRPSPQIDWSKISIEGDQVLFEGNPVFLTDWTWKPDSKRYTEYFGDMDGHLISPSIVTATGGITPKAASDIKAKPSGSAGMIFIGHTSMPKWATDQDPTLKEGAGKKYVMYDINNPLGRDVVSSMISKSVPLMAGNNYTKLGYMLANEPHWISTKDSYAWGEISQLAVVDFKVWLEQKHGSIKELNKVWGTKYKSFDDVEHTPYVEKEQIGTPQYYDFVKYNMVRVSDWFHHLDTELKKADPEAKSHIKIMPDMWSENPKDNGLDLETLTRMSDIIGNDASTTAHLTWGAKQWWEADYSFNWRELCMGYDFMKSVSPNKIIFNSEGHLITTNKYRNLYETPEYIRMNYWLAHIHGMNVMRSWYWARTEDGSSKGNDESTGYAASNNHQPRVVNEVHATTIDLNSVSKEITEFQRQRKSIRLFYSNAAAINNATQMDDLFAVYEMLYFEGSPIGFATEGIIKNNPHTEWDAIVVARTKSVTRSEVEALQSYLDAGGVVILDGESLKVDEYGRPLNAKLNPSKGELIMIDGWKAAKSQVIAQLRACKNLPPLSLKETNEGKKKGVMWRMIKGTKPNTFILSVVNMGKGAATIEISHRSFKTRKIGKVANYLTGEELDAKIDMPLYQTLLLEVSIEAVK